MVVVIIMMKNPSIEDKKNRKKKLKINDLLSFTLIRCDGEDGRKFDPDVGRDNGDGDVRRLRSSINGVFCSRFIVGVLIDDDDDADATVGRGNFVVDVGRTK